MKTNLKQLRKVLYAVIMLILSAGGLAQADDIYVSCWGNSLYEGTIEKIDSNGNVTTFASGLDYPTGLAFDNSGYLYAATCNGGVIWKFDTSGNGTVFASGLSSPWALAFDSGGNLCVANCGGGTIEKFDPDANRSIFASCFTPLGLAFDSSGYLYVSCPAMGAETIEKYDSNGNGATFASGGIHQGLALDSSGYLYAADYSGEIRKYDSSGNWTTFASGLNNPMGLAFNSGGNLYVVDNGSGTIEKFDPNGNRSTFASGFIGPQLIVIHVAATDKAGNPIPANGTTGVAITTDLSWTAGIGATSHYVYFGTTNPPIFRGNQAATNFDTGTMTACTTYYWRIDEKNAAGTITGDVWSFTTASAQATNPNPADFATGVSIISNLRWTAGAGATSHDVYFGTANPPEFVTNQTGTTFSPGPMTNGTTYYWRIDEKNAAGTITGEVWRFTTVEQSSSQATNPNPPNLATGVGFDPVLSWTAGEGAYSHDVYFGTSYPPEFLWNQTGTTFIACGMGPCLNPDTTYYWRIDEVSASGTTIGVVWSFRTRIFQLPGQASAPSPADGQTGVDANSVLLGWTAGSYAASHDVYFGAVSPGTFRCNQTGTTYEPTETIVSGRTYYWRIDEKNEDGTTTGEVWSFTTAGNTEPIPLDGATNVDRDVILSWGAVPGATSYDVYFGTASPGTFKSNRTMTYYDPPGLLKINTKYYWRIDSKNAGGTTTGDVWSFTTFAQPDDIYVSCYLGGTIEKFDTSGSQSTFASYDEWPMGLAFGSDGFLYAAFAQTGYIRKFDSSGNATVFGGGTYPAGIAFDSSGNLYVANYSIHIISKIDPSGNSSIFSPTQAVGLACDSSDYLYSANMKGGTIDKFDSSGNRTVFASGLSSPWGLAFDSSGNLYVSDTGKVYKLDSSGNRSIFGWLHQSAYGMAFDSMGNLFVADTLAHTIVKFDKSGNMSLFATDLLQPTCIAIGKALPKPELTGLEIVGPDEVAENSTASYKAIAHYDNGETKDVTSLAEWSVEPNKPATIDAGQLTTKQLLYPEQDITIYAAFTENDVTVDAEKQVSIFAVCPTETALEFDGVNDFVQIPNGPHNQITTNQMSISAWIKLNSNIGNTQRRIICKQPSYVYNCCWGLEIFGNGYDGSTGNQVVFHDSSGSAYYNCISSTNLIPGNWYHIGVSDNAGKIRIYINGSLSTSSDNGYGIPSMINAPVMIGRTVDPYFYFDGTINELAVFDRALSAEEIQAIMNTKLAGSEPNLVAYWDFDEGEGQTAADVSGNGNDGILGDSPEPDAADPCWIESDASASECTIEQVIFRNLLGATENKELANELIADAKAKEWASAKLINDLKKQLKGKELFEAIRAKSLIQIAIVQEDMASRHINMTIERLEEALCLLSYEDDPDNDFCGWPWPNCSHNQINSQNYQRR